MNEKNCEHYIRQLARLRTDKSRARWTEATSYRAPHKPLLLISVLDLFEQGEICSNLIELSPDLGESFSRYWQTVFPFERTGNLALPFFHLRGDGFWRLLPKPGMEEALRSASQIRALSRLEDHTFGARLDEDLYRLLKERECRALLRQTLLETFFAPEIRALLLEQGAINRDAHQYSKELLQKSGEDIVKETLTEEEMYRPVVRDQGFRRAVVTAYEHRCALCEVRVRTLDGHTLVAAAHIRTWSKTHDDRPANGLALCRTCHWIFDEGLLRISTDYRVCLSVELDKDSNQIGYLLGLEGQSIFTPSEDLYKPDTDCLKWHHENVFRRN